MLKKFFDLTLSFDAEIYKIILKLKKEDDFMIGSVRKRGKTWSYRIDFGKTYDGKRNQIEKGGYKTKKEADKALRFHFQKLKETCFKSTKF